MCAGPATVYRNYMYEGGHTEAEGNQMNNLNDFEEFIDNQNQYFLVKSGYCIATMKQLKKFNKKMKEQQWKEGGEMWKKAQGKIRIGVH